MTNHNTTDSNSGFVQLNALVVGGFKSIRNRTRLELGQLTLLAGANSSGKSSIIQPLLLLKQTLEAPYDVGPLRLQGENVSFADPREVFSRTGPNRGVDELEVGLETSRGIASLFFRRSGDTILLDRWEEYDASGNCIRRVTPGMSSSELQAQFASELVGRSDLKNATKYEFEFLSKRCLPAVVCKAQKSQKVSTSFILSPWGLLEGMLAGLLHVPSVRFASERSFEMLKLRKSFPSVVQSFLGSNLPDSTDFIPPWQLVQLEVFEGRFDRYIASLVHHWQTHDPEKLRQLASTLADLGLSQRIEAQMTSHSRLVLQVSRVASMPSDAPSDLVNIVDCGQGISHVLPVLAALLLGQPSHWIYVEQPELHLHPRAQVKLARYLLDAAKRGAAVIVETHSNLILKGVQEQIASGAFSPDLVKLHWFQQDDTGATQIDTAELDEHGAFGDWPIDFADVEMDIESRYIEAAWGRPA